MKRGFGTQLCNHLPSLALKCPLDDLQLRIQVSNPGTSIFSARCQTPAAPASAPCISEVSTHCPLPVSSRARSAAAMPSDALKNAPRLGHCEATNRDRKEHTAEIQSLMRKAY